MYQFWSVRRTKKLFLSTYVFEAKVVYVHHYLSLIQPVRMLRYIYKARA